VKIASAFLAGLLVLAVVPATAAGQSTRSSVVDSANARLRVRAKQKPMSQTSRVSAKANAAKVSQEAPTLPVNPLAGAARITDSVKTLPPPPRRTPKVKGST
jgi:hypothetical protein